MSVHYEWVGVEGCEINIVGKGFDVREWEYLDAGADALRQESATQGPSIVIGNDDGVIIMAKHWGQLTEFARTLLRMAEDAEQNSRTTHYAGKNQ